MPDSGARPILLLAGEHALENGPMFESATAAHWQIETWSQKEPMEDLDAKLVNAVSNSRSPKPSSDTKVTNRRPPKS